MNRTLNTSKQIKEAQSLFDKILNIIITKYARYIKNDKVYLRWKFRFAMGYFFDIERPKTFYEKLQWLKLYNQKTEYTTMVDKLSVKEYVASKIGWQYIIPTLKVYNNAAEINFDELPNQFVLKCTHDSGGIVICKDKRNINKKETVEKLRKSLNTNFYWQTREWPYKNVKPKIIAEEYMEEGNQPSLYDYKVLTFDGKVKLIEVHIGRFTSNHTQDFYDRDWNKTTITQGSFGKVSDVSIERPTLLEEMIRLSELLAENIPHVRIDWYIVNNKLYFGEITFFDGSGFDPWDRYEDDCMMGSWITLPEKTIFHESTKKCFGNEAIDMFY